MFAQSFLERESAAVCRSRHVNGFSVRIMFGSTL